MTLAEIIRKGHGRSHAWTVYSIPCYGCLEAGICCTRPITELYHYCTKMLEWHKDSDGVYQLDDRDIGRGSVSDQNGCNTAFKVLGLPYYYSRAGGANIAKLVNAARKGSK